jgi:DNA repair protein RAD50
VEYVSKKREIDLRGDMAFQEYYRPCEKEYLLKKMEMDAKEAAARDVEKIARALENTVSRLHKEKMDEVNKSLAEIWSEVYHGGDITCIEIEAAFDEESKRKKGYSYSIVMVTGEKRMEMKGRCSMGQKVLASIVIRLALAEVFSSSARILALDEPTTNLDREHIVNLAQQLGKLIEINDRKYLQMIIITHDLELIKLLQKYTPSYYEISRNEDRFSVITKREITEIFEQH